MLLCIQLFAEQVNAKGGIDGQPLELVIYDNESNPEKSSNNARKLIRRDKVTAMIAASVTAISDAVFFRIGSVAYNICRLFVLKTLAVGWHKHQVQDPSLASFSDSGQDGGPCKPGVFKGPLGTVCSV